MLTLKIIATVFLGLSALFSQRVFANQHAASFSMYTKAHSLAENSFDPRDGWEVANITDLPYKYKRAVNSNNIKTQRGTPSHIIQRSQKKPKTAGIVGKFKHVVDKVWEGLHGIGVLQEAKITWYTGHDLLNPSCWSNPKWAPTDASFACALTLEGWDARPKCFEFLEICNQLKKCVFVRVVDTCAGCTPGSKHIDLTQAAFHELMPLEVGQSSAHFRRASQPTTWHPEIWGPKT